MTSLSLFPSYSLSSMAFFPLSIYQELRANEQPFQFISLILQVLIYSFYKHKNFNANEVICNSKSIYQTNITCPHTKRKQY